MNKRIMSAVLAGAMTLAMAVPAFAEEGNTTTISGTVTNNTGGYVLVIPAGNTNLSLNDTTSAQSIGNLKVTRTVADKAASLPFNTKKKVTVTVASANSGKLKNTDATITANNTIAYTLGIGSTSVTDWTSAPTQDFSATNIDSETAVAMTTKITGDATAVENGTYQDVLTFHAGVEDADLTYTLTGSNAPSGTKLSASAMKASSTVDYTYGGKTYTAYNGYIAKTAYANWADACAFVKLLNDNSYDDCTTWRLLSSEADATAWQAKSATVFSGVCSLWSSVKAGTDEAYRWNCDRSNWYDYEKTDSTEEYGFVVVRG